MQDILGDIRTKLLNRICQNEEHIRLSIVARLLDTLGWDIWDPSQVYAEYLVVPGEDRTKVDFALFGEIEYPWVFIEAKAHGRIDSDLPNIERKLRDYNRNLTAMFSIITDGQKWRFYYTQTGGEFSRKVFKTIDLVEDDLGVVETAFKSFLSRAAIQDGAAEENAKNYLKLTQKQRAIEASLSEARRLINEPPYPSLPAALIEITRRLGHSITQQEAIDFLKTYPSAEQPIIAPAPPSPPPKLVHYSPPETSFGRVSEALNQILEVVTLIRLGKDYNAAVNVVASKKEVHPNTVRDKCTRQLNINTEGSL